MQSHQNLLNRKRRKQILCLLETVELTLLCLTASEANLKLLSRNCLLCVCGRTFCLTHCPAGQEENQCKLQLLCPSSVKQERNEASGEENKLNNHVHMLRMQSMEETNKRTNYFKTCLWLYISVFVGMVLTYHCWSVNANDML